MELSMKFGKRIKSWAMDTKAFWRLYFWWGLRQARREREAKGQGTDLRDWIA